MNGGEVNFVKGETVFMALLIGMACNGDVPFIYGSNQIVYVHLPRPQTHAPFLFYPFPLLTF